MQNVKEVAVKEIKVSGFNPRKHFDEVKLQELADSIKEKGIIEPLIVRRVDGEHHLVCGERRLKAAKLAGHVDVPAIIRELTDEQALEFQIIENLQREDLDPIDEAAGYKTMLKKCNYTRAQLAAKVSKTERWIAERIRLLELSEKTRDSITDGTITAGHGRVLLRLKDPKLREELFKEIVKEKISVHAAENMLADSGRELKGADFDQTECKNCLFKGDNQDGLEDKDTKLKGICLDPSCYLKKNQAYIQKKRNELTKKGCRVMTGKGYRSSNLFNYNPPELEEDYSKKQLGSKYKEKCLKCKHRLFIIETGEYGLRKGLQTIKEICTNSNCFHSRTDVARGELSAKERMEMRKHRNEGHIEETKRRIWVKEITARATARVGKLMVLRGLLGYDEDEIREAYKNLGILQKKDAKADWDDLKTWLFERGWGVSEAKIDKEITRLIVEKEIRDYEQEHQDFLARQLGFDIRTDFIIDKEYLEGKVKDGLIAIAKEIGLEKRLERNGVCDRLGNKKKTELVDFFLKQGFDLKGKVPKEIRKEPGKGE